MIAKSITTRDYTLKLFNFYMIRCLKIDTPSIALLHESIAFYFTFSKYLVTRSTSENDITMKNTFRSSMETYILRDSRRLSEKLAHFSLNTRKS